MKSSYSQYFSTIFLFSKINDCFINMGSYGIKHFNWPVTRKKKEKGCP